MSVLCSFPGRYGDLLWALPTVRAISEHYDEPVDLLIAGEFASMIPLLAQQPYIDCVHAREDWSLSHGWEPPSALEWTRHHDQVYHLGYRRWPELPLPYETFERVASGWLPPLDLTRPWVTVDHTDPVPVACGWSDCHFELKFGLMHLLWRAGVQWQVLPPAGSRWCTEGHCAPRAWLEAAQQIAGAEVFLGDCSALHVLAVAVGKPVVLCEPMEARWNPIFYPLGKTGQVRLVTGNDGLPTFDARHVADALQKALAHA